MLPLQIKSLKIIQQLVVYSSKCNKLKCLLSKHFKFVLIFLPYKLKLYENKPTLWMLPFIVIMLIFSSTCEHSSNSKITDMTANLLLYISCHMIFVLILHDYQLMLKQMKTTWHWIHWQIKLAQISWTSH